MASAAAFIQREIEREECFVKSKIRLLPAADNQLIRRRNCRPRDWLTSIRWESVAVVVQRRI